jgi:DNA-binding CsgD family transcriptional regulator
VSGVELSQLDTRWRVALTRSVELSPIGVRPKEEPLTEEKRERARLAKWHIELGWNPPKPSSRIAEAITDDIERVSGGYGGVASIDLAPREERAIRLAAEGLNTSEAAEAAGVSENTMKSQLREAMSRLGARNKPNAVAIAFRLGIIPTDDDSREESEAA